LANVRFWFFQLGEYQVDYGSGKKPNQQSHQHSILSIMQIRLKNIYLAFLCLLTLWLFSLCNNQTGSAPAQTYLNLQDSVQYVGMGTCRSCHDNVYQTFIHTGMGHSFRPASRENSDAVFDGHAVVYDTLHDLFYFPFVKNDTAMYVLEYRIEQGDTTHKRLERIDYIVGSGQHTNSHIIDINGYVYQAPVTWYTQEKRWDLAPGFRNNNSRFDRWLTAECITCHNHFPKLVEGSMNKFTDMPTGIECERCHGPGEIHVREKLAGNLIDTSKYIDYSIVNPADLPRNLQMDLCQRCHLQGVAVTEPGKSFFDFKPGMKLSETINVFLPRYTDSHEKFIMASQADRLRLSQCFQQAEEMNCLTCHNPHKSVKVTPKEHFNKACKSCHEQKKCALPVSEREKKEDDCSGCHMPKSGSIDIPHVRITDHFITVPKQRASKNGGAKAFLGIEILTKENPTPLDMARGYLALYDKYIASPVMLDSALYYLQQADAPVEELLPVEGHYYFIKQDWDQLASLADSYEEAQPTDGWTAYRIGEAYSQKGEYAMALSFFEKALEDLPLHLDFLEKKGSSLVSLQRYGEAKDVFRQVLAENPERPVALCNLGLALVLSGNITEGLERYDQAISLNPDYLQAMVNKAAVLIFLKKKPEAKRLLERVLELDPDNQQAVLGMAQL